MITRRDLLTYGISASLLASTPWPIKAADLVLSKKHIPGDLTLFTLKPLPYAKTVLQPIISEATVSLHHGAHHAGYVRMLNTLIEGTTYAGLSLEQVIELSFQNAQDIKIFNNAAQVWNHDFYWASLTSKDQSYLSDGSLKDALIDTFGDMPTFYKTFTELAVSQFGSGWCWLVCDHQKKLSLMKTSNADLPLVHKKTALLTCDVWEHAYYLDHQNKRAQYVDGMIQNLWNWDNAQTIYQA